MYVLQTDTNIGYDTRFKSLTLTSASESLVIVTNSEEGNIGRYHDDFCRLERERGVCSKMCKHQHGVMLPQQCNQISVFLISRCLCPVCEQISVTWL